MLTEARTPRRRKPPPPADLQPAGVALWKRMTKDLEFEPRELVTLESACHQADTIARLNEDVSRQGTSVRGSKGQTRLNPAVAEARQARLALMRLLESLDIPADDEEQGASLASRRGRRAANARWSRPAEGQLRVIDG